jgi:hypothetical protein
MREVSKPQEANNRGEDEHGVKVECKSRTMDADEVLENEVQASGR